MLFATPFYGCRHWDSVRERSFSSWAWRQHFLHSSGSRPMCQLPSEPFPLTSGEVKKLWAASPPWHHLLLLDSSRCVVLIHTQRSYNWAWAIFGPHTTSPPLKRFLERVKCYGTTLPGPGYELRVQANVTSTFTSLVIFGPLYFRSLCRTPLKGATRCQTICWLHPHMLLFRLMS